jgi:hypothetical protein
MKLSWAVAAVAIACIGAIVVLSALKADTSAMLAVLLTVVGGLSVATHQQTNGNTSKLLELIAIQSEQLSRTMPAKPDQTDQEQPGGTVT